LGIVTTLSHTGVVLLAAAILAAYPLSAGTLQLVLQLGGGLLIVGMGFWLLYRRLAGQADHFHISGGHHHHHRHDGHDHSHPRTVGWWNLTMLGVVGGMIPCTDAIIMLILAASSGRLNLALPLLLAFSAGLAGVLVAVGLLVVSSKRFAVSRFGETRFFQALPAVSAAVVTGLGLWMCYNAVHLPTGIR
jgi:ABC-type nickel/cobalt efflux system permease component RcnA